MHEIHDLDELHALCGGDTLCLWAAQGLDGRSRAWRSPDGTAVAIAAPDLAVRDRLVVHGRADAAVSLVRAVLAETGPEYRPLGDRALIGALAAGLPELSAVGSFGWMSCRGPHPVPLPDPRAHWLADAELPEAAALLEISLPRSVAWPGESGIEGWAGIRDEGGGLLATAALAWPGPDVGLLAGVAVRPDAQGQGLGRGICALVLRQVLDRCGAAALMVEDANPAALGLYRGLGMRYQPVAVAVAAGATRTRRRR